jgi:hypothetical protein
MGLKYTQIGDPVGIPQVDRNAVMAAAEGFDIISLAQCPWRQFGWLRSIWTAASAHAD